MKKYLFVIIAVLMCFASSAAQKDSPAADDLPLLNGETLNAVALPDYMDDIWSIRGTDLLVFTDKRSGLQGISDMYGEVLLEPGCKYIADDLSYRGIVGIDELASGPYDHDTNMFTVIVCADEIAAPGEVTHGEGINLEDFTIGSIMVLPPVSSLMKNATTLLAPDGYLCGDNPTGSVNFFGNYEIIESAFEKDGNIGVIDNNRVILIPFKYDNVGRYHDDMAIVASRNGEEIKYGYYDRKGNLVIDLQYSDATIFYEGYATVKVNDKWTIIEKDGSMPFKSSDWDYVQQVGEEDLTFIGKTPAGKWYLFTMPESVKKCSIIEKTKRQPLDDYIKTKLGTSPYSSNQTGTIIDTCPNKSFLKKGDTVHVINAKGLRIHTAPGLKTPLIASGVQAYPQTEAGIKYFRIIDGPKCVDDIVWWEIDFDKNIGWVAEADEDCYFLEKK